MRKSVSPTSSTAQLQTQTTKQQPIVITKPTSLSWPETSAGGELKKGKKRKKMEDGGKQPQQQRLQLSEVVSECVKRWFQDTLKEAKAGDFNMQVLLAQMYYTGYGVPKDTQKGTIWMTRASRVRTSVWKVSNKRPGYNASDSDSDDELIGDS